MTREEDLERQVRELQSDRRRNEQTWRDAVDKKLDGILAKCAEHLACQRVQDEKLSEHGKEIVELKDAVFGSEDAPEEGIKPQLIVVKTRQKWVVAFLAFLITAALAALGGEVWQHVCTAAKACTTEPKKMDGK